MKEWKKIIIFSAVLVVLVAVLIVASMLKKNNGSSADATPTPAIDPVVKIDETKVSSVTVTNSNGTLVFTSSNKTDTSGNEKLVWHLDSPANARYSEETTTSTVGYYLNITAEAVASTSGNLSEYGLDKPKATIVIKLKSGEKKTVLYGNESIGSSYQYVTLEGSGRICTTSVSNGEAALMKPLDFMDKNVLNSFTLEETLQFDYRRAKDNFTIKAVSNQDASADKQTEATWKMTAPLNISADTDGFPGMLKQILAITATSFVETAPKDLSKYGLDKPDYEITLKGKDKSVRCILGGNPGTDQMYGYSDSTDAVFIISTAEMTSIDMPFVEMVDPFIHMVSIWELSGIDIKIDGETIHCDVKDDQDDKTKSDFKVNGVDANVVNKTDDSYFRTFYQSLISIYIKGLDLTAAPAYSPAITIDYTATDSKLNMKIGFVKRDDTTYYVFKNGVYQKFYVSRNDFYSENRGDEGLLPAYRILQNAIKNQVNGVYN